MNGLVWHIHLAVRLPSFIHRVQVLYLGQHRLLFVIACAIVA